MNYKQGTANNKILQLREHLTKSNTVSNPDLLKEEQAIIDSMFSEKGRQASKERESYPLSIYLGAHQRRKKRGLTKPLHPIKERGISSAAGQKITREHSLNTNVLRSENSKNLLNVEDRKSSRQENINRNIKSKNKRKRKNTKESQLNKKFEYFSLLAKHNVESRKNVGTVSSAFGNRKESNSVREAEISMSYGTKNNQLEAEEQSKECAEITALERLSYMNACARMELLNANSKLLNFQIQRDTLILKKNISIKQNISDLGNKSMDFTLTFRSDFNNNENSKLKSKKYENLECNTDVENNKKQMVSKKSFSNLLEDNPVTFIKQTNSNIDNNFSVQIKQIMEHILPCEKRAIAKVN